MSESVSRKKSRAVIHEKPESPDTDINGKPIQKNAPEYSPEICKKLLDYFYSPRQKIVYDVENFQSGELKRKKPVLFPPEYPTLDRFARRIGVTVPILYEWEKQYPEFADACEKAKEAQKNCIVVNALNRNFDAGFSKFILCKKFPEEFSEGTEAAQGTELEIHISYGKESGE